MYLVASKSTL